MTRSLAALAIAFATPAFAQAPEPTPLTMQQETALKCSAAFALGAALQAKGEGRDWPPLATRGREFFVRSSAQVMDQTGRSRDLVGINIRDQATALRAPGALDAAMPACLLLLDASGV